LNGLPRKAATLAGVTLVTTTLLLLATNAASDGRMLETMRACATAGAMLWNYAHAPLTFVYTLVHQDPASIVITILLFVGSAALPRSAWREIPTCLAAASLVMVLVLETSPGIDFNHFLDFFGLALIFVGYQIVRGRIQPSLGTAAISIAAAMTVVLFFYQIREARREPIRYQVSAVRAYLAGMNLGARPIFSHNPLFPAIDGRSSSMIDVVMFNLLRSKDPQFAAALDARIAGGDFGAVVLEADVQTDAGRAIVAFLFGDAFLPALTARYELAGAFAPYYVYRPKTGR
jgi:hypothetical protein